MSSPVPLLGFPLSGVITNQSAPGSITLHVSLTEYILIVVLLPTVGERLIDCEILLLSEKSFFTSRTQRTEPANCFSA